MSEETENKFKMDDENFRLYYQLQYDRIDKLETKRENLCNYVLTLSSAIIVLSVSVDNRLVEYANFIIALIIIINIAAIAFIHKTRPFIKMHQKRAEIASKNNVNQFNLINKEVGKINSDEDLFKRNNIYTYLHFSIIFIMIALLATKNKWFC